MFKNAYLTLLAVLVAPAVGQLATPQSVTPTGIWIGKWDNTWCVQFTIGGDPSSGTLAVTYVWREQRAQPLKTLMLQGAFAGNRLSLADPYIEIFFSNAKDRAVAFGHFSTERSAVLVKDPGGTCEATSQSP
jgi:hypothetical protein